MARLFKIITLGCKVNQYESAYLKEALSLAGWRQAPNGVSVDFAVINTCVVTQKAAHQSRQSIRKAIRENPHGIVAAIGCYAQVSPNELSEIEGIGLIADNTSKGRLPELIMNKFVSGERTAALGDFEHNMPFEFLKIKRFADRTRAFLKIQDGCESFCSYCIVPFARGPYRSLALRQVLSMLESLLDQGYKEIVLTGIHLGKYGVDFEEEMNLNRLLREIGKERHPARIRLSSLEPNEIDTELIEIVASEPWLCRHFHIPLQSGDDRILKSMNRQYTGKEFARLIESIHARVPHAAIGVDVMSGFPGEDSVAHGNTYTLIRDLPVSYLHVFPFSPRPGTPASTLNGRVDPIHIKERAEALRDLGERKKSLFYGSCLEKEFQVLAERWHSEEQNIMKGISDNYLPVLFKTSQEAKNQLIPIRVKRVENGMVIGSAL
jgi:threonylcarbamoyladenosine tRNA methylthiotransferase MtaB